jgi:predicted CXXCH cytochrome family protein
LRTSNRTTPALWARLGSLLLLGSALAAWAQLPAGPGPGNQATGGLYSASGHGNPTSGVNRVPDYGRGACEQCHEAHASQGPETNLYPYALFADQDKICWTCHDGAVLSAADTRQAFANTPPNTATDFFKHPVSNLYGGQTPSLYRAGATAPSAFTGPNRHADCDDCHDPHAARNNGSPGQSVHRPAGAYGNLLSGALLGASGLQVRGWQGAGLPFSAAASSVQPLTSLTTNYEWQICFKCHSSFTTLPVFTAVGSGNYQATKLTSVLPHQVREFFDLGQAFNPNNLSFHPVTAVGRNTTIPAGSFVAPWTTNSTMYCADCHNKALGTPGAAGAHASANMHLLERPQYLEENQHYLDPSRGAAVGEDPAELCFTCHRWQTYAQKTGSAGADPATYTNFRQGSLTNLHTFHLGGRARGTTCYDCHDVHGTNKEHLINFNLAYVTAPLGSQAAYRTTSAGGSCNLTCHGQRHSPTSYAR